MELRTEQHRTVQYNTEQYSTGGREGVVDYSLYSHFRDNILITGDNWASGYVEIMKHCASEISNKLSIEQLNEEIKECGSKQVNESAYKETLRHTHTRTHTHTHTHTHACTHKSNFHATL